jgi:hypothetical protein
MVDQVKGNKPPADAGDVENLPDLNLRALLDAVEPAAPEKSKNGFYMVAEGGLIVKGGLEGDEYVGLKAGSCTAAPSNLTTVSRVPGATFSAKEIECIYEGVNAEPILAGLEADDMYLDSHVNIKGMACYRREPVRDRLILENYDVVRKCLAKNADAADRLEGYLKGDEKNPISGMLSELLLLCFVGFGILARLGEMTLTTVIRKISSLRKGGGGGGGTGEGPGSSGLSDAAKSGMMQFSALAGAAAFLLKYGLSSMEPAAAAATAGGGGMGGAMSLSAAEGASAGTAAAASGAGVGAAALEFIPAVGIGILGGYGVYKTGLGEEFGSTQFGEDIGSEWHGVVSGDYSEMKPCDNPLTDNALTRFGEWLGGRWYDALH